jgi:hypothetical protein
MQVRVASHHDHSTAKVSVTHLQLPSHLSPTPKGNDLFFQIFISNIYFFYLRFMVNANNKIKIS